MPHADTGDVPISAGLRARRFVSQRLLGSDAIYEILGERNGVVTAAVVAAPGLESGMRLRLTASAVWGMECVPAERIASAGLPSPAPTPRHPAGALAR
jgi:hypothetical protein